MNCLLTVCAVILGNSRRIATLGHSVWWTWNFCRVCDRSTDSHATKIRNFCGSVYSVIEYYGKTVAQQLLSNGACVHYRTCIIIEYMTHLDNKGLVSYQMESDRRSTFAHSIKVHPTRSKKYVKICHRKCRTFEQHSFEGIEKKSQPSSCTKTKIDLKFSASLSQYFRCLTVFLVCYG